MSTMICLKEGNTLVLGTDSRFMKQDYSGIASDEEQKVCEVAPETFLATSGRKMVCDWQTARAGELAEKLGTTDIQIIGEALWQESVPCLMRLVERLRLEPDETTKQHVSGESLLHGCTLVGRTAGGKLGFVHSTFRAAAGGIIECTVEAYFEAPRKIMATSGGPAHLFVATAHQFQQNMANWIDPPEQAVARFLAEMRRSTPTVGGPDQIVLLDNSGS